MGIIYSKCYNGVIMVPGFADGSARFQTRMNMSSMSNFEIDRDPCILLVFYILIYIMIFIYAISWLGKYAIMTRMPFTDTCRICRSILLVCQIISWSVSSLSPASICLKWKGYILDISVRHIEHMYGPGPRAPGRAGLQKIISGFKLWPSRRPGGVGHFRVGVARLGVRGKGGKPGILKIRNLNIRLSSLQRRRHELQGRRPGRAASN